MQNQSRASAENRRSLLREAQAADLPAVCQIYRHHVETGTASFEEVAPALDVLTGRWASVRHAGLPFMIAEIEGRLQGFAYASPYRTRSAYRYTVENSIYVAEDGHRRGIGRALLAALINRCAEGGWRQMLAIIGGNDNAASIALHARMGFEHVGTMRSVGFKFGDWVDSVLMQRSLGEGDRSSPDRS